MIKTFKQFISNLSSHIDRHRAMLAAKRRGVDLDIAQGGKERPYWKIHNIENKKGSPGAGTETMTDVNQRANKHHLNVHLIAGARDPNKQKRLEKWYKRQGYKEVGPKFDWTGKMRRPAQ